MNYTETTIAAALTMQRGELLRIDGIVTMVSEIAQNSHGKSQRFVNLVDGAQRARIVVFEEHATDCACKVGDRIHAYGRFDKVRPINELSMIGHRVEKVAAVEAEHFMPAIISGKYDAWNGLTEAEALFLQVEDIPPDQFILPQVAVGQYRVDFVFYRKLDRSPVIVVEIDGDTHVGRRAIDAQRTATVERMLGCSVVRIDAARIYSDARKKGLTK